MMFLRSFLFILASLTLASAFTTSRVERNVISTMTTTSSRPLELFKKPQEDLSDIETRDMTREEMLELNKKNEDIMNAELIGMTVFSLILSIPMLYLVYVGFFSETAGINLD